MDNNSAKAVEKPQKEICLCSCKCGGDFCLDCPIHAEEGLELLHKAAIAAYSFASQD